MITTSIPLPGPPGPRWDTAAASGMAYATRLATRSGQRAALAELTARIARLDQEVATLAAAEDRTPAQNTALNTAGTRRWIAQRGMPQADRLAVLDDDALWDDETYVGPLLLGGAA